MQKVIDTKRPSLANPMDILKNQVDLVWIKLKRKNVSLTVYSPGSDPLQ